MPLDIMPTSRGQALVAYLDSLPQPDRRQALLTLWAAELRSGRWLQCRHDLRVVDFGFDPSCEPHFCAAGVLLDLFGVTWTFQSKANDSSERDAFQAEWRGHTAEDGAAVPPAFLKHYGISDREITYIYGANDECYHSFAVIADIVEGFISKPKPNSAIDDLEV